MPDENGPRRKARRNLGITAQLQVKVQPGLLLSARRAAASEGMTLGQWIRSLMIKETGWSALPTDIDKVLSSYAKK